MTDLPPLDHEEIIRRIGRDLADSYDEELELELEDLTEDGGPERPTSGAEERQYRRHYFRELLRLQAELVKLQDWVWPPSTRSSSCSRGVTPPAKGG